MSGTRRPVRSKALRGLYLSLGLFFFVLGAVGLLVPILPTTLPILLAAFFFARSSPRFDAWLENHKVFGRIVRGWRSGRGYTPVEKTIAVVAIIVSFSVSLTFFVQIVWLRVIVGTVGAALAAYVVSLPTRRD